nr:hypothetical protein CFP56_20988 [Quercus suber]
MKDEVDRSGGCATSSDALKHPKKDLGNSQVTYRNASVSGRGALLRYAQNADRTILIAIEKEMPGLSAPLLEFCRALL